MNKKFVDSLVSNMKQANLITKAGPWTFEGQGEKSMSIRFVGITTPPEWAEVISSKNNVLIKFVIGRNAAFLEYYLANKTPFTKFWVDRFNENTKWEHLFGNLKNKLKNDKEAFIHHSDIIGNIYKIIAPVLKD